MTMTGVNVAESAVRVGHLLTEYLPNPMGIDQTTPGLSWRMESDRRGTRQTAYQIQVAASPERLESDKPDMWESGKVASRESVAVRYAGKKLMSRAACVWRVRVWDENGVPSAFSDPAQFEMGLLEPKDWSAGWVSIPEDASGGPAPMLRQEFTLDKPIKHARAYVTGLGYYELRLNGKKAGGHVLDPPYTDFGKRIYYSTYDVTKLLKRGRNCAAAMLGHGFWQGTPRLLLQLEVTHTDGSVTRLVSGDSWKWVPGPITENSIYEGETYDTRLEQPGWDKSGFDDAHWKPVVKVEMPGVKLSAQGIQPIRVVETMKPKSLASPKPGIWIYDLGQNISGWCRLEITGKAGTTVTLRHAERLYADGTLDVETLRGVRATDTYTLRGDGKETYEPRFTYHGFRYIELTGFPGTPTIDSLRGRLVHTGFDTRGSFVCSNKLINRIQQASFWGQRDNFLGIPTDCAQRGERQGWLGDAWMSADTMLRNFDMPAAYSKYLQDMQDAQSDNGSIPDTAPHVYGTNPGDPMWSVAYPLILWQVYLHTGDKSLLERHYENIKRYVEMLHREAGDSFIITRNNYGDWLGIVPTPTDLISTGGYLLATDVLIQVGVALGKLEDVKTYLDLRGKIASAFNARFFDQKTTNYGDGSQLSNALPLCMGLVPDDRKAAVIRHLLADIASRDGHLSTGFIGAPFLFEALAKVGRPDVGYIVVTREDYPGWGYMIANDATTVWESWVLDSGPIMHSHNHPAFGFISGWFYEVLAGIAQDQSHPGWEHFSVKPHVVGDLKWAKGKAETIRGLVASSWKLTKTGIVLDVTIPANSTATVFVPTLGKSQFEITEGGKPIWRSGKFIEREGIRSGKSVGDRVAFEVGSGAYSFELVQ